jgi:hypothetical protein
MSTKVVIYINLDGLQICEKLVLSLPNVTELGTSVRKSCIDYKTLNFNSEEVCLSELCEKCCRFLDVGKIKLILESQLKNCETQCKPNYKIKPYSFKQKDINKVNRLANREPDNNYLLINSLCIAKYFDSMILFK